MKKYLLMLIAAGISLSFVGCDSSSSSTNSKSSGSNTESSASSSDTNSSTTVEHKVGEAVDIKGEELTVKTVKKNYETGSQFLKPDTDNQYVKIDLSIKNNTDNSINVSPFEFKILDSSGVYHDTNFILKDPITSTKIAKGGNLSGSISFEVPKNDDNLKLIYTPSLWSDDHVEIKL